MSLLQSLILGAFQGIAEFLPISSSGHLLLFKNIMGLTDVPQLFDVILHLATLLSILVVFRKRVWGIIRSCARFLAKKHDDSDAENLAIVVPAALATLLTALIGLAISKLDFSSNTPLVCIFLLVTAVILLITPLFKGTTGFRGLGMRHGIITGIAQGLGVFPGISRSGITISGGMASGMGRAEAGEFSFLLAIPAVLGALVLEAKDLGTLSGSVEPVALGLGALAAFVVGVIALRLLMPIVRRGKLAWFAAYLIPAGILGLIFGPF